MLARTWIPTGRRHDRAGNRRRGTALAMSLIVVTMVAMLGAGFLQITSSVLKRRASSVDRMQAFYLAEAGLSEAFQAVRMGRTGQIGSEAEPARHGNGLLWVDVVELADGSVRLDSTGLSGRGRASLALVVEPIEKELGFFADEDLVVDSVLLVDGWDSEESTYAEQLGQAGGDGDGNTITIDLSYPYLNIDETNQIVFYEQTFYRYGALDGDQLTVRDSLYFPDLVDQYANVDLPPAQVLQLDDFTGRPGTSPYNPGEEYDLVLEYFERLDKPNSKRRSVETIDPWQAGGGPTYDQSSGGNTPGAGNAPEEPAVGAPDAGAGASQPGDSDPGTGTPEISVGAPPPAAPVSEDDLGPTTGGGALLGSNGDVRFNLPEGETGEIWGDVQPGPSRAVTGLDSVTVTGSTDPRTVEVELPEVEVPIVAPEPALRHDDLLPMLVSQGTSAYERIEVAADAELVLRGPAEVVIGELVLEPGATLALDTRAGEVALYVLNELDLQPGSVVENTGQDPEETTVQVAADDVDPTDPSVKLDGTSQFYGTIYAPDAGVRIGSDFEIFGGVVARRIDVGAGARLHFDSAGFENSALPKIIGWRVTEVPAAARRRTDPFKLLGVDKSTVAALSDSHDLGSVEMELVYLDHAGVERSFLGKEDQFDWDLVDEVVQVDRDPTRPKDPDAADPTSEDPPVEPPPEPPPADPKNGPVRDDVAADLASKTDNDLFFALQAKTPLNTAEVMALIEDGGLSSPDTKKILQASGPLADEALTRILERDSAMTSEKIRDVLLANSPLSADVLALVESNPSGELLNKHSRDVLEANR